jgi:Asp-tRNA(Asn)/Glu-tRNA(Gln) amidotransferase A subunit family amidase
MSTREPHSMHVADALAAMAQGELTARGMADAQLAHIAATNASVGAWAHLDPDHARACAERSDAVPASARGALHGIGVGVKDIIATAEYPTEMGSPVFAGNRIASDAECVVRLKQAGGYVFGKTVTTELAYFHPGATRNPWNPQHTPGGSSSGSAAAVAAGHIAAAIGTQTNGSMIRPAAFCGVVGFKPTKDAIPRDGVNVFSDTLDQIGTFGRSVADAAHLAGVLADIGRIASDTQPSTAPPALALLRQYPWTRAADPAAAEALDACVARLRAEGATVTLVEIPDAFRSVDRVHRTIMMFEGAANLGALQDRERARLSVELNAALDEGRAIAQSDYEEALRRRVACIAFFTEWHARFDAVISPPAPGPAPEGITATGDPSCCTLYSLAGFPALTIPVGRARNGLPLGMQIATPAGADNRLLAVAAWCEVRLPFAGLV